MHRFESYYCIAVGGKTDSSNKNEEMCASEAKQCDFHWIM